MSNLTSKQIAFCREYITSRDAKQSSINAGYSESYSKSKAYEMLKDEKILIKIREFESEYNQNHFKRLSTLANEELENILLHSENDTAKLRAIELIYKLSGIIRDDKISLNINNTNQNNTKSLNDFYNESVEVVWESVEDMEPKEITKKYIDLVKK